MASLKTLTRATIFVLLLVISGGQESYAKTRLYQYDGKLPFAQMMLDMMVAMGILDRLPVNGGYGNYGRYGNYGNHGRYGNYGRSGNPLSPWSRYSNPVDNSDAIWGSPGWGVLPVESYVSNHYSPYGSPLSADDLTGWVNESWEVSEWNPKAESKKQSPNLSKEQSQPVVPIVQNFNYSGFDSSAHDATQKNKPSPLAKLVQPEQSENKPALPANKQSTSAGKLKQKPPRKLRQKPCVTDFCGLKKPSLNGLWVAQNGEMLGVNNHRYLWSDNKSRYMTGQIKVQNEYLLASVDGSEQLMRFKYKLAGNRLLMLQPDGKTREFSRVYDHRDYNDYGGYGPGYGNY